MSCVLPNIKDDLFVAILVMFTIALVAIIVNAIDELETETVRNKQFRCVDNFQTIGPQREGFAKVKVGANSYKIHEDLENPQKAAETMDSLNTVAKKLIDHLYDKYVNGSVANIKKQYQSIVVKGVKAMKMNFKTANMEENIPERSGGDTSYVIDKGDVFAMCLRDPKNGHQIDPKFNDLTFVLIHELGHLFSSTYGHDTLFWNNFKFILQEATLAGLYTPVDYKKTGSPYCGIVITYSPLFDTKLDEYRVQQN